MLQEDSAVPGLSEGVAAQPQRRDAWVCWRCRPVGAPAAGSLAEPQGSGEGGPEAVASVSLGL